MVRLILGSQSPRRKEIMSFFSLPFEQIPSDFDEEAVPFEGDPVAYVKTITKGKSRTLSKLFPKALILTADTTVYFNGKIYNKPKDEEEAFKALSDLSGNWHSIHTAVSVCKDGVEHCGAEETKVLFNPMTADQIRHYHSRIHWADKAGGYAIQMGAGLVVSKIEGCFYNAMGLPINTVRALLLKHGIELWDYVK